MSCIVPHESCCLTYFSAVSITRMYQNITVLQNVIFLFYYFPLSCILLRNMRLFKCWNHLVQHLVIATSNNNCCIFNFWWLFVLCLPSLSIAGLSLLLWLSRKGSILACLLLIIEDNPPIHCLVLLLMIKSPSLTGRFLIL